MKQYKLKGKIRKQLKKKFKLINAKKRMVEILSDKIHEEEKRMWKMINNEIPNLSGHCDITNKKKKLVLTDYGRPSKALDTFSKIVKDKNDTSTTD